MVWIITDAAHRSEGLDCKQTRFTGTFGTVRYPRWTAWRAMLEGIFIAYSLIFVAAMNPAEFSTGIFNGYTAHTGSMLLAILVFYGRMESRRRKTT